MGRTGMAHGDWLTQQGPAFTSGIHTATLNSFHGYAVRDELPEVITVLDAFYVAKLGGQVVEEVRSRVQQDILGHRGRAGDPRYGIRRTLQIGAEHLTEKQIRRLDAKLEAGDPHHVVAWLGSATRNRARYTTPTPRSTGGWSLRSWRRFRPARSLQVARPGRALRRWRSAILAYFDTDGASNGHTEAINGVIETKRRVAPDFQNFENYRLRALLAGGGYRPRRHAPTHAQL